MRESTKINNSFLNACQDPAISKQIQLDGENPFIEDDNQKVNRVGYVYKIWRLQEEDKENDKKELKICIRCSVHSHVAGQKSETGGPAYMNVYAVNEFNTNLTQWRSKLDQLLIPCLNKEITSNSFKMTKWLVQSLLADVEYIKFAFVSRKDQSINNKHVVLSTHTV
jgi:translation initiation factor 3 subunit D